MSSSLVGSIARVKDTYSPVPPWSVPWRPSWRPRSNRNRALIRGLRSDVQWPPPPLVFSISFVAGGMANW